MEATHEDDQRLLVFSDCIVNRLCYHKSNDMTPLRIRVIRNLRITLRSLYHQSEMNACMLSLRIECSVHKKFFYSETKYKQNIVTLMKKINVSVF